MKKYMKLIALTLGMVGLLASCDCKTCKKDSEISELVLFDHSTAKIQSMRQPVKEAVTISEAANEARNLINAPSNLVVLFTLIIT